MDSYTQKTRAYLDERFKKCSDDGIYIAHQPIYGFRKGYSEQGLIVRYIQTCRIMDALSRIEFNTLLDVGAAEGYKAYVAKTLFKTDVTCTDLSEEACSRASEIFGIKSIPADIHSLPFKTGEFDVALCSETLEHVTDFRNGVAELLRISKKAVVITIPHESRITIKRNIDERQVHGHIHHFDVDSFNYLESEGYRLIKVKMFSPILYFPLIVVDAMPIKNYDRDLYPESVINSYNRIQPWLQRIFGEKSASCLITSDKSLCKLVPSYKGVMIVVIKELACWRDRARVRVRPSDIFKIFVPYYHMPSTNR